MFSSMVDNRWIFFKFVGGIVLSMTFILRFLCFVASVNGGYTDIPQKALPLATEIQVTATPDTVCQGAQTQLNAAVTGGTEPYTYQWSSRPAGFTSGIANPTASPMVPTWFIVVVTDALSQTVSDSVFVAIADPPLPPGAITGPDQLCKENHATYSIAAVPGAYSYSWSVPEGDVIENGQNTTTIGVYWHSTEGPVSVIAGNDCGNSVPTVLMVILMDTVSDPGPIISPDTACALREINLYVVPVNGSTGYNWSVPSDASIVAGDNTPGIRVLWGATNGVVSVSANNICGESHHSSTKFIVTDSIPSSPAAILGKDSVCLGQSGYTYSFPPVANARHYVWSVPAGATIIGTTDTNSIIIEYSNEAVSGNITMFGQNDCGDGVLTIKPVVVRDCTAIPDILSELGFSVFPNPASDRFIISGKTSASNLTVRISDINGRPIVAGDFPVTPGDFRLEQDVSGWEKGIYIVRITVDKATRSNKILIR
jgi:large repetitive protein